MYHFEYVPEGKAKLCRAEIRKLMLDVQEYVRDHFTFQFEFIGSSSRNMVTWDPTTTKCFDFDLNLYPNYDDEEYSAEEVKRILRKALDRCGRRYGFGSSQDSTRVITVKKQWILLGSPCTSVYSCDFAIVHDWTDDEGGRYQEYIRNNKADRVYFWAKQNKGYAYLKEKEAWLKKQKLWNEVREVYLDKKNNNLNPGKKSRALYAETISEVCQRHKYGKTPAKPAAEKKPASAAKPQGKAESGKKPQPKQKPQVQQSKQKQKSKK